VTSNGPKTRSNRVASRRTLGPLVHDVADLSDHRDEQTRQLHHPGGRRGRSEGAAEGRRDKLDERAASDGLGDREVPDLPVGLVALTEDRDRAPPCPPSTTVWG
jgi:hypothetical protein